METENTIEKVEPASPLMNIISAASADSNMDADKLMKLLEVQERWEKNEARKAFVVAMSAFQAEAPKIVKDSKGHNSSYAKLPGVIAVVAPLLSKNELSYSWVTNQSDKGTTVTCKITHILGHSEATSLFAGNDKTGSKNDIQALGSTVTYLKRYTLEAALGLAEAEQDDDGNGACDPNNLPEPTSKERKVLEEICNKMIDSVPEGLVLVDSRVDRVVYALKGRYPDDIKTAGAAAAGFVNMLNRDNTWHTVTKEAKA
jgi:hypothetical protein